MREVSWKWVQIVVEEVKRLLCTTRGWRWRGGGGSFPGAGQGGLKEAIKGPCNGISNVSLPLKHGGKKHLLCIVHSPATHLSFKLSGRATRFREAHIFSGRGVVSQARRVRRTQGRTDVRSLAIGPRTCQNNGWPRCERSTVCALARARSSSLVKKKSDRKSTSPPRASASQPAAHPHSSVASCLFFPRPPFAKRCFTVLTPEIAKQGLRSGYKHLDCFMARL